MATVMLTKRVATLEMFVSIQQSMLTTENFLPVHHLREPLSAENQHMHF